MKRKVMNMRIRQINEMAYSRKDSINRISKKVETYGNHILKCAVYQDTTGSLKDWYDEIASYLEFFDLTEVKDVKSLKLRDYQDILSKYANSTQDFKSCLLGFKLDNHKDKKYPDFTITPEMVLLFEKIYNEIKDAVCPLLAEKQDYTSNDYATIVKQILANNGIKEEYHNRYKK